MPRSRHQRFVDHDHASAFFGVDFFLVAAAFFVGAALVSLAGAFVLVTRPDLVFLRTFGVSTTAGAWFVSVLIYPEQC